MSESARLARGKGVGMVGAPCSAAGDRGEVGRVWQGVIGQDRLTLGDSCEGLVTQTPDRGGADDEAFLWELPERRAHPLAGWLGGRRRLPTARQLPPGSVWPQQSRRMLHQAEGIIHSTVTENFSFRTKMPGLDHSLVNLTAV